MYEFVMRNWIMISAWYKWRFRNPCEKNCLISAICSRTGKSACERKVEHEKHAMYYYSMKHTLSKQICRDWGIRDVSHKTELLYLILCYITLFVGVIGVITLTWGVIVIIIRMWP